MLLLPRQQTACQGKQASLQVLRSPPEPTSLTADRSVDPLRRITSAGILLVCDRDVRGHGKD